VIVDPQKLAARGLTIADVRRVLRDQNKDTSGGDLWESKRRYVVRTLGQFRSPEQVAEQILAIHDGTPVRIGDVADRARRLQEAGRFRAAVRRRQASPSTSSERRAPTCWT
jgi:hydrophobic/amphiphilic exporter-1 (mainly G- bacteria), HAE1 family